MLGATLSMYDLTQYDVIIFVRSAPSLGVIRITMLSIAFSPPFLFAISNLGPTYEDISLVTASKSNNRHERYNLDKIQQSDLCNIQIDPGVLRSARKP